MGTLPGQGRLHRGVEGLRLEGAHKMSCLYVYCGHLSGSQDGYEGGSVEIPSTTADRRVTLFLF
jgi:hypothetical protein